MPEPNVTFNLEQPPLFFVCGLFEVSNLWRHKPMYQQGNWEVILVLQGKIFLKIEDVMYTVEQGQCFLVPPYQHMVGYHNSPIGTRYIWIHFFPQVSADTQTANPYYTVKIPRQFKMNEPDHLLILAYQILDLARDTQGYPLDAAVLELLLMMGQDYNKQQHLLTENTSIVDNVKVWIDGHLESITNSEDIARTFNFNSIYLNRRFKQQCHVSLYQYVIDRKIDKAKQLLTATEDTIYQISQEVYFKDSKNFSRAFKKRTGLTPSRYRHAFNRKFVNTPSFDPEVPTPERITYVLNQDKKQ
ncbi:helix-turn-helix domain-containing protein [Levilactobacillus koreensis]|uniref:HTH araC/xylS-type domain-containing protein n=1 Tax=Levilactobacillus koreensis TaxID=637971 RepID=A0AAC8UWM2_9LACO|nr:AraC family transcriptional regulator [Levilactobacillus koreensis]AKP64804.1 hypothetical protein ABN16_07200 [Levilactobacillus koreensis]